MKALFRRKTPPRAPAAPSPSGPDPSPRRRHRHSSGKRPHATHRSDRRRRRDLPYPLYSPQPYYPLDLASSSRHHHLHHHPHHRYPFPPPFPQPSARDQTPVDFRPPYPPFDLDSNRSLRTPSPQQQQRRRRVVSPSPSPPPPTTAGRNPTPGPATARALAAAAEAAEAAQGLADPDQLSIDPEFDQEHLQQSREILEEQPYQTEEQLHSQGTTRDINSPLPSRGRSRSLSVPPRGRSRSLSVPRDRSIQGSFPTQAPFPGPIPPYDTDPLRGPPRTHRGSWKNAQGPPGADFLHRPPFGYSGPPPGPNLPTDNRYPPENRFSADPLSASSIGSGRVPNHPREDVPPFEYPGAPPPRQPLRSFKPVSEIESDKEDLIGTQPLSDPDHHSPPPDSLSGASSYSHIRRSSARESPHEMPRAYPEGVEPPIDGDPMAGYDAAGRFRSRSRGRSRSRSHSRPRSHSRGSRSHSRPYYGRSQSVDRMSFASTADPYLYARNQQFNRNPDLLFPGAAAAYMGPGAFDPYMNMGPGPGPMPGPFSSYGMMPGAMPGAMPPGMPPAPGMPPGPASLFQGDTPGLVFQSARPFMLYISGPDVASSADNDVPWLQLADEMDGRLVVLASFRNRMISLHNDTQGDLLNLVKYPPSESRRGLGGRVVIQSSMGDPIVSAVVPGSRAFGMHNSGMYGNGPMNNMYRGDRFMGGPFGATGPYGDYYAAGGRFANEIDNAWHDGLSAAHNFVVGGADAFAHHAMSEIGPYAAFGAGAMGAWGLNPWANHRGGGYNNGYGYSPYNGYNGYGGMYGRHGTPGDIDPEFMQRYGGGGYMGGYNGMNGMNGMGSGPALADFYPGDKALRRSSRRKLRIPVMRLLRARDGVRQILQAEPGYEVASFTLVQGSGAAGVDGESLTYRLVVQPGMDVAMVVAALACNLWISADMGASGMNMPGMGMGMPGMGY